MMKMDNDDTTSINKKLLEKVFAALVEARWTSMRANYAIANKETLSDSMLGDLYSTYHELLKVLKDLEPLVDAEYKKVAQDIESRAVHAGEEEWQDLLHRFDSLTEAQQLACWGIFSFNSKNVDEIDIDVAKAIHARLAGRIFKLFGVTL